MFELSSITETVGQWWSGTPRPSNTTARSSDPWLPAHWRQTPSRLLDQQFWCFGQDIVQAPRNALLELGFTRHRSSVPRKDGSCYSVTTRAGVSILLWGFGVFYCDRSLGSAILLVRDNICPLSVEQLQLPINVWDPHDLPKHPVRESEVPVVRQLLTDLLHWFSQYENWIATHRDPGHRERILQDWRKVVVPAETMSATWQSLADELQLPQPERLATA